MESFEALLPLFALNASYLNMNHGSYGAVPRAVLQAAQDTRYRVEANPDRFFRDDFRELLEPVLERLARLVGASPKDLVLVENASHGVNAVLRSLHLDTHAILGSSQSMPTSTGRFESHFISRRA